VCQIQSHNTYIKPHKPHFFGWSNKAHPSIALFLQLTLPFSHSHSSSFLNPSPTPMAALAGSSSAATSTTTSARFRRSLPPPPSQLPFTRARFSVKASCPFFSDNNNSLPQNVVASKPSPLELLKTSAADSKSSSIVPHSQICQNLNLMDNYNRV